MFGSIEFYIITAFVAAAVIGFSAMPSRRGTARTFLFGGELFDDVAPSVPGIVFVVGDDGVLDVYRFGIDGVDMSGAYSLALTIIGFDITIEERLTAGRLNGAVATAAHARIDCLGRERYHFLYRNEAIGRSAAFSLNIRPGNRIERLLE